MILALTSDNYHRRRCMTLLPRYCCRRISQIRGVGQVMAGGSSTPAVRIDVNPDSD